MDRKKKKKKYKKIPDSVKVKGGIPGLISGEKTYRYEEEGTGEQINIEKQELKNELVINQKQELAINQKQEIKIELGIKEKQEIMKGKDNIFQVKFDPELIGKLSPDSEDQLKCRVNFFSKKGTVAITKIWQHVGGEGSFTRMKILDGKSKEKIDGGWSETNVFSIKENELKGIFLIFYREKSWIKPNKVDHVGVEIITSEGDIKREFDIEWEYNW